MLKTAAIFMEGMVQLINAGVVSDEEKGQKSLKDRISNKQEEVAKKEASREPVAQKSKKMAIG